MRVSVVGLGPGPVDWITSAATSRLRLPPARVFVRTRFFPQLDQLLAGIEWQSFDDLYEQAESLAEVETLMAERLLAAGRSAERGTPVGDSTASETTPGEVVLAVPGVPLGVSALAAAGLSAADGVQVVEATSLGGSGIDLLIELNPRWPAVVTGVFSPRIAGDLKLALQRVYPPEHAICLVYHAGLDDEQVVQISLAEMDRARLDFDHLTHAVLPPVVGYQPTGSTHGLRAIV